MSELLWKQNVVAAFILYFTQLVSKYAIMEDINAQNGIVTFIDNCCCSMILFWFFIQLPIAITTDKKSISLLRYAWTFLSILSTETRWSSKPKHCVKYFNNTASDPAHKKLHSLSYWNYMFLVVILFLYQRHLLVYKNIDILGYLTHQVHYIWNEHYEEWCFFYNYTTFIKLKWIGI